MNNRLGQRVLIPFIAGLAGGALLYHSVLFLNDLTVTPRQEMLEQSEIVATLRQENEQLYDELFRPRVPLNTPLLDVDLPYDEEADARLVVAEARVQAIEQKKFLMVIFGANWCHDCRNLHKMIKSEDVQDYTRDLFLFVNVDVGKFNRNKDVAAELGVSLQKGIPVAIFFDDNGKVIGTTNEGQLEPARWYSSKQILKFVRDVAERSRILAPDTPEAH